VKTPSTSSATSWSAYPGRAIYTGDSQLQERVEVLRIEPSPQGGDVMDLANSPPMSKAKDRGGELEQFP